MKVLVTGAAGFIGSHVSLLLLIAGHDVVGLDNLNDYYDVNLKKDRLKRIEDFSAGTLVENAFPEARVEGTPKGKFSFVKMNTQDRAGVEKLFKDEQFDSVVNLAAQPGVRYSLEDPFSYIDSNVTGFLTILEGCRHNNVSHLVYASSSSVYGANENAPYSVENAADHPLALYGATKRANELMAHSYSHLFNIPTTGLRFFTVYGPWGRPDMSPVMFAKNILSGDPINVFNNGKHTRDFTFVEDIARGVVGALINPPKGNPNWDPKNPDPSTSKAPWAIHNIGNQKPIELMYYIKTLEECLGKKAILNLLPLQPGDVQDTSSNVESLVKSTGYSPSTSIEDGIKIFVDWYRQYYSK